MMEIGIQISSVRKFLQDDAGVRESFMKVANMGYKHIQVQWVSPDVRADVVQGALTDAGLDCVGTQDYYDEVVPRLDAVIADNILWGGRYVTVSGIPARFRSPEGCVQLAMELDDVVKRTEAAGLTLAFHPVYSDYAPHEWRALMDILLEHASASMQVCLDAYHVVKAGHEPSEWIRRLTGRIDLIHFKDYAIDNAGGEALSPVGQGVIDWDPVIRACLATGVKYCFAEQETSIKDPFDCLAESYDFIRGRLRILRD